MIKLIKDALILCIITLTAGLLLASVYEITKEPILKASLLAKQNACFEVFKEASYFEESNSHIDKANNFNSDENTAIDTIMLAYDTNDQVLGYVLQITNKEGYGGDITFMMGVNRNLTLNGISFLTLNETPGLGQNANKDTFKNQFIGLHAEYIEYTKNKATKENEIDALSGATITTKAITNAINCGLSVVKQFEEEGF